MRIIYTSAMLLVLFFFGVKSSAQTTLINPATNGGFELGADFASNGWTVANGTVTNKWFVGTVPAGFTNNAAYISRDAGGALWEFTNSSASVVHFYRDVTFPSGESDATLTFNWQALGETGFYDALMVGLAPTSYVPTASSTSLALSGLPSPVISIATLWNVTGVQTATIKIPASVLNNCSAAVTYRLIFTWKNDASGGLNPPAAIDNISLISQNPSLTPGRITTGGGTFSINGTLPNTGSNFTTFEEAINSLNGAANFCQGFTNPVVFNVAANQVFNEVLPTITASGTVINPITFQRSGAGPNPVVMRTDGGSLITSTFGGQGDAIISITGGDFISFNGIDVTSIDQGIEYGYLLRKASGTDGCKNITIKNAAITMTRGTSIFVTGIYSSNLDANTAVNSATGVTVSSTSGRHENVTITGNTISNVFYGIHLRGFAAVTPFDFYDQNFIVGASGAGNENTINNFGGTGTAASYGIYVQQHNAVSTNYNNINNLDNGGNNSTNAMYGIYFITGTTSSLTANFNNINLTGLAASGSGILSGIFNSSFTGNLTIDHNTISLNNTANSSSAHTFIHNGSGTAATAVSISNNNFAASQFTTTATSHLISNSVINAAVITIQGNKTTGPIVKDGNSSFFGYVNTSSPTGFENFFNNNFSDITVNGTSGFTGFSSSAGGTTLKRNIYGNTISNITAGGTTSIGILKGTGNSNIYRNKIFNLTANGTTSTVYGIQITGSVKDSIYNNIIGDLFAPNSASATNAVAGIHSTAASATSTLGIYYNTINLNASSSGANFGTNGIFLTGNATATTSAVEMKNNIIVNNSTPNGTGYSVVFRRSSTSLSNLTTSTNNNLLYTNSPGGNTAYYYDGTNLDYSIADFRTRVSPRGTASVSENPNFLSTNGPDANYLHINTTIPTQIESGGSPVGGITTDFDGDTRNTGTPDMGADEFNGIPIDLSPPGITYAPLLAACSSGDRTITNVNITDASGVPLTGALMPRIYYKKAPGGAWFSKPGTLASGSSRNGLWSFTIVAADMGGLTTGDNVNYFVIAQDSASPSNIGANPSGVTASNVNTVTVFPASPNSYSIGLTLNGTYTVGAAGTFNTLTSAVNIYNSCPLGGPTVFSLIDANYAENFPVTIGVNAAASLVNTLTIKPATGNNVLISGTTTTPATSIIKLDGADHIIIDGSNNNTSTRNLTIENLATVSSAGIWVASLGGVSNGANNNTIKNVIITGGSPTTTNIFGIVSGATTAFTTAGEDNDNLVIENDSITKVNMGISILTSATTALAVDGLIIRNNSIGNADDAANSIGNRGIQLSYVNAPMIIGNRISNIRTSGTVNTTGIDIGAGVVNGEIRRNKISGIYSISTSGYGAYGINFSSATATSGVLIANNFISDLITSNYSSTSTQWNAFGIRITGGSDTKIYYNSIHLSGDVIGGTATGFSAGLIGTAAVTGLDIRNNIFSNSTNFAINGSFAYGIYFSTNPVTPTINYNNYFGTSSGTTTFRVGFSVTPRNTLTDWKAVFTPAQDANSKDVDPLFMSNTDLHLQATSPLDQQATPITLVTIDIDEQVRDASIPDIGADEINVSNCAGAVGGTITPGAITRCESDSTIITGAGFSTGAGSAYQWESSADNVNFNPVSGANSPAAFNTRALSVTTYFRLKVSCTSGTAIAYSNTVTITVNQRPTVNVSPNGPISICAPATQVITVTNTSATTPSYQWQMNGTDVGTNSASYTAASSGSYTVKVTDGPTGCFRISVPISVTINPKPSDIVISPASATLCNLTDPAQLLTATGGTIGANYVFGTQANQNTPTGFPSPFTNYWGGNRHQLLVLASELSAAGFGSGTPLNSINFNVVSLGSSFTNNQNFKVKIGHTTNNTISAFAAGLTTVFGPSTVTPTVGYNNQIVFVTPFVWNGTDNLIIETTYSNGNSGVTNDNVVMYNSPTTFQSTIVYRSDSETPAVVEAGTTVNLSFSARPDFTLSGSTPTNMVWSPIAGLFTNAGATIPYVGGSTNTVYAKPGSTTSFTATATSPATCTNTKIVVITVTCPIPVTLLNFKGERKGTINSLEWTTATEINNAGFELQRSADGSNFSQLVFVPTKATGGNSSNNITYNFDDIKPLLGNGYYRLKQVDKDGKFTFSPVVTIKGAKTNAITLSSVYPNPAQKDLNLVIIAPASEKLNLIVTDLTGRVMMQQSVQAVSGENNFKLQVERLATGTYFIKAVCANGCETTVQKFVKQ